MKTLLSSIFTLIIAVLLYQNQASLKDSLQTATSFIQHHISPGASHPTTTADSHSPNTTMAPPTHIFHASRPVQPRRILKSFLALSQAEGAGATVRRSIGTPALRSLSPFLMLDHFRIAPGAGFPDHPHRGQETITYLLSGAVDHEDFAGHRGTIWPGDLQFMTAGRGIVHAEMPHVWAEGEAEEPIEGMQLWVDLPRELKGCEPRYRDLRGAEIPRVRKEDGSVEVVVISGESQGVESLKELAYTPVWLLDVRLKAGGRIDQALPAGWNAFVYVLEGNVRFAQEEGKGEVVGEFHNVVLETEGEGVRMEAVDEKGARLIVVAGTPLDQPVVQYGPFVVNSKEEVYEAMHDFQGSKNGFERANGWRSDIGRVMLDRPM